MSARFRRNTHHPSSTHFAVVVQFPLKPNGSASGLWQRLESGTLLITKGLIEIPPKFAGKPPVNPESNARLKDGWKKAEGLAEDVRYYGKWIAR